MNHYFTKGVFFKILCCLWLYVGLGIEGKGYPLPKSHFIPVYKEDNSQATALVNDSIKQMLVPKNYEYLELGDDLLSQDKKEDALIAYEKAKEKYKKEGNVEGYFTALNKIGYCQRRLRRYDESFATLSLVIDSASKVLGQASLILADAHHYMGQWYDFTNDAENAILHYKNGMIIRTRQLGDNHILVADSYQNLGNVCYYVLKDYKNADIYFNNALRIYANQSSKDEVKLAANYDMLSKINRRKGDYENALIYSNNAIEIFDKLNILRSLFVAYDGLAGIHHEKKNYREAIDFYNSAITLEIKANNSKPSKFRVHALTNIGTCYLNLSEYKNALSHYYQALNIVGELPKLDNILESDIFSNIGVVYGHTRPDSGKVYLCKALELRTEIYGETHKKVSNIYNWFGDLYLQNDDPDSALIFYQKALFSPIENLQASDLLCNPAESWMDTDLTTIVLLKHKTKALMEKATFSEEKETILQAALNTCLLAKNLIYANQVSYFHEGSKLFLLDEHADLYELAIDCGYQLFMLSKDEKYIQFCFEFMEARKAAVLSESFQYADILNSSGIPDSVLDKRNQLIFEQEKNNKIIAETENSVEKNTAQDRLFEISRDLEDLAESLENNFPQYKQLGRANKTDIAVLQQDLSKSASGLIEYLYGENAIYGIGMNKGEMIMHKIDITQGLQDNIKTYLDCLKQSDSKITKGEREEKFLNTSWYLYHTLFEPFQPVFYKQNVERIVFIPDGLLSFIPFESFITKQVDAKMNFKNAHYFLYDFKTSYHFSAGLFNTVPSEKRGEGLGEILAFSFSRALEGDKLAENFSLFRDDEFSELPGTADELEIISKYVRGEFISGKDATKALFIEKAQDYNILHLAIHGVADAENKYKTRLIFNSREDDPSKKNLYSHELYNLNLKSELVVLSACESGLGKQYTGEGVFSMARGFVYAGVPSVVNTLWEINDNFSADIMAGFYQNLADGKQVDESLQQAKINYIHQADEISADPANWAAFVLLGEKEALTVEGFLKYSFLIYLGVIFIGLGMFFYYKKRKARVSA